MQSWDVATSTNETNDYSVCTTWLVRKKDYYLLHLLRDRLEHPELKRKIISMARARGANSILIEKAGIGLPLIQALRQESGPDVPNLCMANSYLLLRCDSSKPRLPQIPWVLRFPSLSVRPEIGA